MKQAETKHGLLWNREHCLKVAVICLRIFKETGDEEFYNHATWFGNQSRELKEIIAKHE